MLEKLEVKDQISTFSDSTMFVLKRQVNRNTQDPPAGRKFSPTEDKQKGLETPAGRANS